MKQKTKKGEILIFNNNTNNNSIFTKFTLTEKQTKILYNLEYLKTKHDIFAGKNSSKNSLKFEWLTRWEKDIHEDFSENISADNPENEWLGEDNLIKEIV